MSDYFCVPEGRFIKISHEDHVQARTLLSAIEIPLAEYLAARKAAHVTPIEYMNSTEIVARDLASKARQLIEGMRARVQRDPDIADFAAAFEPILIFYAAKAK